MVFNYVPALTDEFGFCPKCTVNPRHDVSTNQQWRAFKTHLLRNTHGEYGLGKQNWYCGGCETGYTRESHFIGHPCSKKKTRQVDPNGVPMHVVRYTKKKVTKNIHKQAKLWSLSVMFGVAYEEKFCLPGNNFWLRLLEVKGLSTEL